MLSIVISILVLWKFSFLFNVVVLFKYMYVRLTYVSSTYIFILVYSICVCQLGLCVALGPCYLIVTFSPSKGWKLCYVELFGFHLNGFRCFLQVNFGFGIFFFFLNSVNKAYLHSKVVGLVSEGFQCWLASYFWFLGCIYFIGICKCFGVLAAFV